MADSSHAILHVGLENQGATCFMNAATQTLFHSKEFRRILLQIPVNDGDEDSPIIQALQSLFRELEARQSQAISTSKLTESFDWDEEDVTTHHDPQEFLRLLLEAVQNEMGRTRLRNILCSLFRGTMTTKIQCLNIDLVSLRPPVDFDDLQLVIKGFKNINEAFKGYVAITVLDGKNQYDTESDAGHQDAEKRELFVSLPPLLHVFLNRLDYGFVVDPNTGLDEFTSFKLNDRFEFSSSINLDHCLVQPESTPADYTLYAVIAHQEFGAGRGHYMAYIDPNRDGRWFLFNDGEVRGCTKEEAIDGNFGDGTSSPNAYMLSYFRNSIPEVSGSQERLPSQFKFKTEEEKALPSMKRSSPECETCLEALGQRKRCAACEPEENVETKKIKSAEGFEVRQMRIGRRSRKRSKEFIEGLRYMHSLLSQLNSSPEMRSICIKDFTSSYQTFRPYKAAASAIVANNFIIFCKEFYRRESPRTDAEDDFEFALCGLRTMNIE